jgi:hypothetical protein
MKSGSEIFGIEPVAIVGNKSKREMLREQLKADMDAFLEKGGNIKVCGIQTRELSTDKRPMYLLAERRINAYTCMRTYGVKDRRWSFLTKLSELTKEPCLLLVIDNYNENGNIPVIMEKARLLPSVDLRILQSVNVGMS